MLFTSTLIAGGILYTGLKVYEEHKKDEKIPWTFNPETRRSKKGKTKRLSSVLNKKKNISLRTPSKTASVKVTFKKFKENRIDPLSRKMLSGFTNTRHKQLKEISADLDEGEISEAEKKLNRDLSIASTSLVLATVGALVYGPISVLSIPGILWTTIASSRNAYCSLQTGQRVEMHLLEAIFFGGSILTGNYFAGALGTCFTRLSKKLLLKTEDQSKKSLINVFGNQRRSAWLVTNDAEVEISVEKLELGNIIAVHAGEIIPVDGTIVSGTAHIDQHILTGESQPVEKDVGDHVFASTIVLSGAILVEVEKAGQDTVAAQIGEILNQTADFKNSIQSWGEEIANNSALATLIASAVIWPFFGTVTALTILNTSVGFYIAVLGPLSMLSFLNLASYQGILVKDGRSLQLLSQIDTIVFDKTGTLTLEQPYVGAIHTCMGISATELLTVAAAAEYKQTHPIAKAILQAAHERALPLPEINEARYEIGYGLQVRLSSHKLVRIGSARFMEMESIAIPPNIKQLAEACKQYGHSFVYVAINDQLAGAIELHTTIRPEAKQVVRELHKRNMDIYIISGDHEEPTKKLAQELGIDNYFAETLPENKADLIAKLQEHGKQVCFVGDGINDSIALKKANVSISLRGASSAATDTAQIILMNQNLTQLIQALDVAQRFETNMKFNTIITILPGLITIYGAFFLGFGMAHSVIMNDIGVVIGVSNAVWPWFKEQRKISK